MNETRKKSTRMDGRIQDFQLLRRRNEGEKYEYFIECNLSLKIGNIKFGKLTIMEFPNSNKAKLLFHVHVDKDSNNESISIDEHIGELDINEENGIIELYLIIHTGKTEPNKKPKGKVMTGSAKPKI